MEWIGALLLIISTTCIGLYKSTDLERRPKHIRQAIQSLQLLEAEITYSQAPLQMAFKKISLQLPLPLKTFFQQLDEDMQAKNGDLVSIWCNNADDLMRKSSLNKTELEVWKQFGHSLGQHDFIQQQKQIQLTIIHLERQLQEAYDEQKKYANLSKSLGVLSGVFLVLLLI